VDKDRVEKTKKTAELYFKVLRMNGPLICGSPLTRSWPKTFPSSSPDRCMPARRFPPDRQLITVACLTVLSRLDELKLHIQGALNVGCSPAEIAEVIFQTFVYGGMPATNQALKTLRAVLIEKGFGTNNL